MKRFAVVLSLVALFSFVSGAWAVDEALISKNVDTIVVAIEGGDDIMAMTADAYEPYMFIMEEGGKMLVHPSLAGESLKEKAPPVYTAGHSYLDNDEDSPKKKDEQKVEKTSSNPASPDTTTTTEVAPDQMMMERISQTGVL